MNSGLLQGKNNGLKMGKSLSNKTSGLKKGLVKKLEDHTHMQDPKLLTGVKKPVIFCIADYYTQPDNSTTIMTDLCGSGYSLWCNAGSSYRPAPIVNDIFNNKTSLDFPNSASYLVPTPTPNFAGYKEFTYMTVVKLKGIAARIVYHIDDTITPGGVDLATIDTLNTLNQTMYGGQPGTITNSVYTTYKPASEMDDWLLITSKVRLSQPGGPGSEQELYIGGSLQHKLVSSNFNVVTTAYTSSQNLIIGNDNSILSGTKGNGTKIGSVLLLPYWVNESEQIRLENYFRHYYGYKF